MTLFSIITVTWNSLEGLIATRASVALQDYDRREHLVIDGASTDGTVDWLRSQRGADLRWISEPDAGIYDAMNKAAELARGDYLVFLNSGDTLRDSRVLERWAKGLEDRPEWQYGRAIVVDMERRPIRPDYGLRKYSVLRHAYKRGAICHQAVAMRRDFFHELGGFRIDDGIVADFGLLLRAGICVRPHVLESIDVDYLDGGVSATIAQGQQLKHKVRSEALGFGRIAKAVDYAFAREQQAEINLRKRLKAALLAGRTRRIIHERSARNLPPR